MKKELGRFNTFANYLSLSRLLLIVPILYFISRFEDGYPFRLYVLGVMAFGFTTDLLDGYVARKFNQISEWGKIIDPFADKLTMGLIAIQLYRIDELSEFFFWLIVARDMIIFVGGIWVGQIIGKVLPSNFLGKISVFVIGFYLVLVIAGLPSDTFFYQFVYITSIVFCFLSLLGYAIRAIESIKWYKRNGAI